MSTATGAHGDLFVWARGGNTRVDEVNAEGALGISGLG